MLQNPRKTLAFKKNMVYKIPPGGEVNHIQPVAYLLWLKGIACRDVFKVPEYLSYIQVESYLYETIYWTLKYLPVITLCMPAEKKSSANSLLQTVWTQMKTNRMSVLIWIETVWHSDGGSGWFICKNLILKKGSRRKHKHEQFPSMQIDKYRTFAK